MQLVKMKGRVACEISTCECIIATEAIFRGLFTDLDPAEAAAVLCTLVNQNKTPVSLADAAVPAALRGALRQLQALTAELGGAQRDVGLKVDPDEYVQASVRPSLTEVRALSLCSQGVGSNPPLPPHVSLHLPPVLG